MPPILQPPAAGHQDEPQENPAAGARCSTLSLPHPPGAASAGKGAGSRVRGRGPGIAFLQSSAAWLADGSSPPPPFSFLKPDRRVHPSSGFALFLCSQSTFHTFFLDLHNLPEKDFTESVVCNGCGRESRLSRVQHFATIDCSPVDFSRPEYSSG